MRLLIQPIRQRNRCCEHRFAEASPFDPAGLLSFAARCRDGKHFTAAPAPSVKASSRCPFCDSPPRNATSDKASQADLCTGRSSRKGSLRASVLQSIMPLPENERDSDGSREICFCRVCVDRRRDHARYAGIIATLPPNTVSVLRESLAGLPVKVIAHRLEMSQRSVKRHRANGLRALGCRTLIEASGILVSLGVLTDSDQQWAA